MPDHIDEFESMFRRAEKEQFSYVDIPVEFVTIVSDQGRAQAESLQADARKFIRRLDNVKSWRIITGDDYRTVADLTARIDEEQTDLLITYRHL